MKPIVILPILAILCSPAVYAKCNKPSKTIFSCLTQKGKQIEVCDTGKTIAYSFGKPNAKAELTVAVPRAQASTHQWDGMGRYISYAVDIPNGNTVYNVFYGTDKLDEKAPVEAGVNVLVKNNLAATVKCSGKNIVNNMEGIALKASE